MELNEHGRRALERFRKRRMVPQPFLDRRTLTLATLIAVVVVGTLWVVQRALGGGPAAGPILEDLSGFSVYLHHQGCPGQCPVYAVLVRGDGTVEYEGVDFVATAGARRSKVDELTVRALAMAVRRAGFDAAPAALKPGTERCERWRNGRELMQLGVTRAGRTQTLDYYPGCDPGDPRIDQLTREIDALAGTARWINPGAVEPAPRR